MRHLRILVLLALLVSPAVFAQSLRLSAGPGKFNAERLAAASSEVSFSGAGKLLKFHTSPHWPTAAYVGIHQGTDRNNSVQILMIRNQPKDGYLVVGYRLIVDGKEVKIGSIDNVPLDHTVQAHIRFIDGLAFLRVGKGKTITLSTPFKKVAPYVSVSSGDAEFVFDL